MPEAPSATENGGTQAPYGISQYMTNVEQEGEGWGLGLGPENFFRATPSRTSENALLEHGMEVVITIDIFSQSENESFNLRTKYKEVTMTLAFEKGSPLVRRKKDNVRQNGC